MRKRQFDPVVTLQLELTQSDVVPRTGSIGPLHHDVLKLSQRRAIVGFVVKRHRSVPIRCDGGHGIQDDQQTCYSELLES